MRSGFAKEIDPIFLATLRFIERIERGERLVAADERATLLRTIEAAETAFGQTEVWQLAKFAVCAWIDAQLIEAPWPGKGWWNDNRLVPKYFGLGDASEQFFQKSTEAVELASSDALEVFYAAVALGFRGFYGADNVRYRSSFAESNGLPRTIEGWCRATARKLQSDQHRELLPHAQPVIGSAEPLTGKRAMLRAATVSLMLCGLATGIVLVASPNFSNWLGFVAMAAAAIVPGSLFLAMPAISQVTRSPFPATDRALRAAMQACARQAVDPKRAPCFVILGAHDPQQAQQWMRAAHVDIKVEVPADEDADFCFFATSDAIYLFLTRCSCLSRLAHSPEENKQVIEQRLRHVCQLLSARREPEPPVSGILYLLPFDMLEHASGELQAAVEQDLATLRNALPVRCSNTVLITQLEQVPGFQEMVKQLGPRTASEFRFGKGMETWVAPEQQRLKEIAAHAVKAIEDWIYMLFQSDDALMHRYNSRLFKMLCSARGQFAENLQSVLASSFGFDPLSQPEMADRQFWFGGCYFVSAGSETAPAAFAKSVFRKGLEKPGECDWTNAARQRDRVYHWAARGLALLGGAALLLLIATLAREALRLMAGA